ncbi:MAG: S8 family serine peptidase [Oscillospiraceae bacterium]|nr:S8 family serine peptidase [Oscillospiraceae bacterium]
MKIKKVISGILALVMVVSLLPVSVFSEREDERSHRRDRNGTGQIYHKGTRSLNEIAHGRHGNKFVKNQILVIANSGVSFEEIERLADRLKFNIVGYIETTDDYQLENRRAISEEELENLIDELNKNSLVESAMLNYVSERIENSFYPNDRMIQPPSMVHYYNWNLYAINAPEAWGYYYSIDEEKRAPVKIGLIDNKFYEHEDIEYKQLHNNYPNNILIPKESDEHGTQVAGMMAAEFNNGKGIAGICPKNELYAYSIYGDKTADNYNISVMDDKVAFATLIANNVRVINCSWGWSGEVPWDTKINERDIMDKFFQKLLYEGYDFLLVASAGNNPQDALESSSLTFIPESSPVYSRIIVVSSIDYSGDLANKKYHFFEGHCYGDRVDIVAPGARLATTEINNSYTQTGRWLTGTSLAAPHVSGVAGMMYSINPNLKGYEVKNIIINSAEYSARQDPNNRWVTAPGDKSRFAILDADESVKSALKFSDRYNDQRKDGIALGNVTVAGTNKKVYISDVEVKAYEHVSDWVYVESDFTNEFGDYLFAMDRFDVNRAVSIWFEFTKPGFESVDRFITLTENNAELVIDVEMKPLCEIKVTDPDGAPIEQAFVMANSDNASEVLYTDASGEFKTDEWEDGVYTLSITKSGFQPRVLEEVKLENGTAYYGKQPLTVIVLNPLKDDPDDPEPIFNPYDEKYYVSYFSYKITAGEEYGGAITFEIWSMRPGWISHPYSEYPDYMIYNIAGPCATTGENGVYIGYTNAGGYGIHSTSTNIVPDSFILKGEWTTDS